MIYFHIRRAKFGPLSVLSHVIIIILIIEYFFGVNMSIRLTEIVLMFFRIVSRSILRPSLPKTPAPLQQKQQKSNRARPID
jgi:hypothetical protein